MRLREQALPAPFFVSEVHGVACFVLQVLSIKFKEKNQSSFLVLSCIKLVCNNLFDSEASQVLYRCIILCEMTDIFALKYLECFEKSCLRQ